METPADKVVRLERLNMAGYDAGSRGRVRYNNANWTTEESEAYGKGWEEGRRSYRPKKKHVPFDNEKYGTLYFD